MSCCINGLTGVATMPGGAAIAPSSTCKEFSFLFGNCVLQLAATMARAMPERDPAENPSIRSGKV